MKVTFMKWSVLFLAVALFAGCSSMQKTDDSANAEGAPVTDGSTPPAVDTSAGNGSGADTQAATESKGWQGSPLDDPDSPLYTKVVYFDFDRSDIRSDSIATLRAHAEYLLSHRNESVTIEGHCDERGSREYNIGLGERRASAIKQFMEAEGVSGSQINTISYGEERPADPGHNEAAWALNRRGVLNY